MDYFKQFNVVMNALDNRGKVFHVYFYHIRLIIVNEKRGSMSQHFHFLVGLLDNASWV